MSMDPQEKTRKIEQVRALRREGLSVREITKIVRKDRRWVAAATGETFTKADTSWHSGAREMKSLGLTHHEIARAVGKSAAQVRRVTANVVNPKGYHEALREAAEQWRTQARQMRMTGLSCAEVARRMGRCERTVQKACKGVWSPEIERLKQEQMAKLHQAVSESNRRRAGAKVELRKEQILARRAARERQLQEIRAKREVIDRHRAERAEQAQREREARLAPTPQPKRMTKAEARRRARLTILHNLLVQDLSHRKLSPITLPRVSILEGDFPCMHANDELEEAA